MHYLQKVVKNISYAIVKNVNDEVWAKHSGLPYDESDYTGITGGTDQT